MFFKVFGFKIEPVLACLGPVLGCLDVTWACLEPVLGLSGAVWGRSWAVWRESGVVSSRLDLSGGFLGVGFALEIPEILKTGEKNKEFFRAFGFKSEPVLACLGPVLGCAWPVLGCLVLSWAVMDLFWSCPGPVSGCLGVS